MALGAHKTRGDFVDSAVATAKQMHDCLTVGNMSAYIMWKAYGDANGLVNASGVPQKRGFVFAQWSRFVRPNDYRVGVTNTGLLFPDGPDAIIGVMAMSRDSIITRSQGPETGATATTLAPLTIKPASVSFSTCI